MEQLPTHPKRLLLLAAFSYWRDRDIEQQGVLAVESARLVS